MLRKFKPIFFLVVTLLPVFILLSCKKDVDEQFIEDLRLIESYIEVKGLENVQRTEEGLHYVIIEEGDGVRPSISSEVRLNYVGRLLNDNVFDSGFGSVFYVRDLIKGWQLGLPLIKEGGRILLIIPSKLGYGSRSAGLIPPNSVLVFDITLLEVLPE